MAKKGYQPRRRASVAGVPKPNTVIRKKPKSKHGAIRKNAVSVYKLAKQVNQLKMSQYGSVQRNMQNLVVSSLVPTASAPLLFDTTDFSCFRNASGNQGCQVYQVTPANTVLPASGFNIQDWAGNAYWSRQNADICDTGKYLPLYVKYTIRITGNRSLDNTRIRFDLFSARAKAVVPTAGASANNVVLPGALVHLKNMANPTLNRLNPTYFKCYTSKTIFINSQNSPQSNTSAGGNNTANIRYYTFIVKPRRPKYQALSNPDNPQDPTPEVSDGNFGPLNVPIDSPLWMLISTDDATSLDDRVEIQINRECKWRDSQGSANLY